MADRRITLLASAAAAVMALTAGCGGASSHVQATGAGSSGASPLSSPPASGATSVEAFYRQKLLWKKCDQGECAKLRVPIDYAKPGGATIEIAVNRMKATGERRGSLVVNPGGPGASGVDYAAAADAIFSQPVRKNYDVVGFDPRGVQRSAAITCVDDATLDEVLGSDPSPDDAAEQRDLLAVDTKFASACKKNAGPLLGHVSTHEAARDMDVLRSALGEDKLNYLGKSYGTYLGATYADLFPKQVGRMVLDGVLPPDLSMEQINEGQAKGFEKALDAYLQNCVTQGSCPLGSDVASAKKKLDTWLTSLDTKVVRTKEDSRLDRLSEGWASNGLANGLYDEALWPGLTDALRSGLNGDGTLLLSMGKEYAERNGDGTYNSNIMQAINAITCLDRPAPAGGTTEYEKAAERFSKVAPTWGPQLAWASATCAAWPFKATNTPRPVRAAGSAPILVLGTTRDPATPYEWSQRLAGQLENARLLTYNGDGHTAYGRGSQCVDAVVDRYYVSGAVPEGSTTC